MSRVRRAREPLSRSPAGVVERGAASHRGRRVRRGARTVRALRFAAKSEELRAGHGSESKGQENSIAASTTEAQA